MIKQNEKDYHTYVQNHKRDVKTVWAHLQNYLKNEFRIGNSAFAALVNLVEEHDASKLDFEEFRGYRQFFFPEEGQKRSQVAFNRAWNHHQKRNPHHWQFWVMYSKGVSTALKMPLTHTIEMMCDWCAMSVKFKNKPSEWYKKELNNMLLHEETKCLISRYLPLFDKVYEDLI